MSSTPTEQSNQPVFRTINLAAEVKKIWGPKWNAPEPSYEFSGGRKFELRTEDFGPYQP